MKATALKRVALGGTFRDFMRWCGENKVHPMKMIYADTPEKLLGLELKESEIVRLGPIEPAMEQILKTRIR